MIKTPEFLFELWVHLRVQSMRHRGQRTRSSVKHTHSASHKPQSICAAGAALVCQSNITLKPKIACIWLRARCLSHVCINTCERLHLTSRSASAPEEFRGGGICRMQFGCDGHDTKSKSIKATLLKISPQKCIITQWLTDSIGLPDECENKLRKLALFYYLLLP